MIYPKIPLAQSIIEICNTKGLHHIVISPGSRNAPLTIGFTNNPVFTCYSIADERCAAFFALGIAQQLKKPVALVCTSGSALLNYYPAFAEAFYSQIPLVVISADRPQSKIDIGDGQTIRQENVFANHSLYNANLVENVSEENDTKIQEAIHLATTKKGPVHINVPFEEPLYETVDTISVNTKIIDFDTENKPLENLDVFVNRWNDAKKKLILIGGCDPNVIQQFIIDFLANDTSVVVMTEVTSNVHHANFITNIDAIITPFTDDDFTNFQPEILITMGGMIVSKRIKAFLRKYKPQQHWHIDELRAYDTFGSLTKHFEVLPSVFFKEFIPKINSLKSNYLPYSLEIKKVRTQKTNTYLATIPFSDFKAFEIILPKLPLYSQLQISNSSAIRYAQLFSIHSSIEVFCNRGTSGIDGSTSTAIGAAIASGKETILITGDISFLYDSNALWNNYIPENFKIILLNNGGGGIFRILPGHKENETFNTYFETSHRLTAKYLAKMYNFGYEKAVDEKTLEEKLKITINTKKSIILEVFTPTKVNDLVLLNYFKNLT
ncbi:2-succinyl-5-enolpyruvyl-6-hydroxy-3-cyclohexene-1-carboxylic-acid synthase [Flavobacterium psychrophilum]|uniref:2-succinyl-5-enolpyruvyl-6-hydroxy-3- cyclohexene-1-carboxylic-acid synthase n=1 Tax=Flavobacterium psychrophilum TaxID=96345 RepID=UPI0004F83439|nr:2-succinyl-5-enolpyruvyl-6-hydroxy-3-cyclohexene-1-carboxylic-acid synthase [Flavobacterium psychrophilum]AIN74543.1 2-succinyl-5-enolpyruvyl-6-hydroxy-3-cyclohexene-1-carboxylate synthase [Flavobacterium psychrophilum FPG3]EKT2068320.1 2-succinyl-5-enolpyruvyl-6-hydroxy-3-cyclohexene-1-carboxylic-acid synthase [Flavobacterium psychrophilum]EKT2071398.1 2-succinyl-5-enolpyruvyl-6-hydroxy-3-cyclohexene-1-carboxylic-acid synthase [Flavobacterium psychrophilum]EKT4490919.1 2-succinyl-5-enolpyru